MVVDPLLNGVIIIFNPEWIVSAEEEPDRIDQLYGNAGKDLIRSFGGNDDVSGKDGADRIEGRTGEDTLDGGVGNDIMLEKAGIDTLTSALNEK